MLHARENLSASLVWFCLHIPILCGTAQLCAQAAQGGIPPVWNFSKKAYKAGAQNWSSAQTKDGRVYFANNEGLLRFDGKHWDCYPVANRTIVRSVAVAADDQRIYVGAQGEFGYFEPNQYGILTYHSLVELIAPPDRLAFEDVWEIQITDQYVYFSSFAAVFAYSKLGSMAVIPAEGQQNTAMFAAQQSVFVQSKNTEILELSGTELRSLYSVPELQSKITGAIAWAGDTTLLTTLKDGIFFLTPQGVGRWQTPHDEALRNSRIYHATALRHQQIAIGTSMSGLYVLGANRRMMRHLHAKNGLQNNNILSTDTDAAGNLWLGLDNGIDCVVMESPFTTIVPDADLKGTGYAAAVNDNRLYLGVSNGVYRWNGLMSAENYGDWQFEKIKATDGQVWTLQTFDSQVLMGHHEGSFAVNGTTAQQISNQLGAWTFVQVDAQTLIGGHYQGLALYRKAEGKWRFERKIEGIDESCRIIVCDEDKSLWVAHPYRGLYHITSVAGMYDSIRVDFFNQARGLPSDLNNFVFSVASKALFSTEKGLFRFQAETQSFAPDTLFNRVLGQSGRIKYLKEDHRGNIWFVGEQETGLLQVQDYGLSKSVKKLVYPELHGKLVGGIEFIYPFDDQNTFFGAEHGFFHFNGDNSHPQDSERLTLVLRSVHTYADSILYGGNQPTLTRKGYEIDHKNNEIEFSFAATYFKDPNLVRYRVRLKGSTTEWSVWSQSTESHYAGLPSGRYVFQVQAMLLGASEPSEIIEFPFTVLPPWYLGTAAMFLYFLSLVGALAWYVLRQRSRYEQEKAELTDLHRAEKEAQQREVERSKLALNTLQQQQLETEIQFKNRELASATMHLVQKGEILLTVQENLNDILSKSTNPAVKKEIQHLINLLNFDATLDEDWEQFTYRFDQVHVDFLKRLREKYPQLSTNDFKLCAYLRMNLSTKEIAPLMNISVRGVEASRYRLRKKLDLPADANLVEIMLEV